MIWITIDTKDPRPIYRQIIDEVHRAIAIGAIRANEPVPSVRRLAADLGINPNTVKQAYRELERTEILFVKRGQGTYLRADVRPSDQKEALAGQVAARALLDARRHGLTSDELVAAITRITTDRPDEETDEL